MKDFSCLIYIYINNIHNQLQDATSIVLTEDGANVGHTMGYRQAPEGWDYDGVHKATKLHGMSI